MGKMQRCRFYFVTSQMTEDTKNKGELELLLSVLPCSKLRIQKIIIKALEPQDLSSGREYYCDSQVKIDLNRKLCSLWKKEFSRSIQ